MAVAEAHVFPGFLTLVSTNKTFFPKPPTTFLMCYRGERENTPERKLASTGYRTHNHQVISPTRSRSPLSHWRGTNSTEEYSLSCSPRLVNLKITTSDLVKAYGLANQKLCYFKMTLNIYCIYIYKGKKKNLENHTKSVFNHFPNRPLFFSVCCASLSKTLSEKEKLLVTSNFSFSHSFVYSPE